MAIARLDYANYASSAKATSHVLAWPVATTAGSLLLCFIGWNEEGSTVTQSIAGGAGGWTLLTGTPVERLVGGLGQLKGALYYKEGASAQSGNVTATLSASHHATIHLVEYSGVMSIGSLDVVATSSGTSASPVSGTTAALAVANELRAAFIVAKNTNAETAPTNSFTQVGETGQSTGGGAAERSGYYEKIAAGTAADGTGCSVSASVDYVGLIATFKPATSGATVQVSMTGSTPGPRQFPLGPKDMSGAVVLTDTTPGAVWTPTHPGDAANAGLRSGVDYLINCPVPRSRKINIVGGRDVVVPKYLLALTTITDNEMFSMQGGDASGSIFVGLSHLDNNGLQCDGFKTHTDPKNGNAPFIRDLMIKVCKVEKLIGQTSQVHADLIQVSGGIGDTYIEDFTGYTTYDGLMYQREANLEQQTVKFTVSNATSASGNYTYTTSAAHGYNVGDVIVIWGLVPNAFNGGYTILSTTSTSFTCKRGDTASPGAVTSSGFAARAGFAYPVGSIYLNRFNAVGFHNDLQGTPSNQAIRFGARTAPQPNAGNPGQVLGLPAGHVNEDQTPLNIDQWNGALAATNWYGEPDTGDIGGWVEPDEGTSNYSGSRPVFHAAAGGQPAYCDWPNHPNVVAGTKFQQGPPPGGDFVSIQSGIPVQRVADQGTSGVSIKVSVADIPIQVINTASFPNAYDRFERTVGAGGLGTADLGGTYTMLGTAADFSVTGHAAVIALTAVQVKRAVLANIAMLNQVVSATMQTDTAPAGSYTAFDVYLRYIDANNWYRCRVALNPAGSIQIRWERNLASVLTTIGAFVTTPLTVQTANDYTLIAQAIGTAPCVLNAYVYDAGAPPPLPLPFQVAASDSSSALQVVSAAGIGCALNTGSTATSTHVSVAQWDAWPTRMSVPINVGISVADARINVPIFAPPGTGTKHRHTPR
jgi:hypothetical protein